MFKKKVQRTIVSSIEPEVMTKQMEQDYTENPENKGSTRSKNKENKYAYISIKEQKSNEKPKNKRKQKKLKIVAKKENKLLKKQLKKNNKIQVVKEEPYKFKVIKKLEVPLEVNEQIKREEISVEVNEQIKRREIPIEKIEDINKLEKPVEIIEEIGVSQVNKKDLSEYFEENRRGNRKLFRKEYKRSKNKQKKKEIKIFNDFKDVKNRKVYTYRKKCYENVEDFILFLNDNYLNIDRIAKEVLDDENFYGWISEKSGVFDFSIMEFKDIKDKIEKN